MLTPSCDQRGARDGQSTVDDDLLDHRTYDGQNPPVLRRLVVATKPFEFQPIRPERPFVEPGTVVLTDNPALLAGIELPSGALVLSTHPASSASADLVHLPQPTPEGVAHALAGFRQQIRHVRLLTEMTPPNAPSGPAPSSDLALHDLLFLTVQQCFEGISEPGATLALCLLGGWAGGAPHPSAGMWTGLVKSVAVELRQLVAYTVLTTATTAAEGIAQVTRESGAKHFLPVVVYENGVRMTSFLEPAEPEIDASAPIWLGPNSVVLAAGGARGIAAELLLAIAQRYRPTIYVLGRSDAATEQPPIPARADYIRLQLQNRPGVSVADLTRDYQRMVEAGATRSNLDRMAEHCGAGRVHYLRCNLSDKQSVQNAVATVRTQAGRVDLLLNVAGLNRAAGIPTKRFEDFRAVRDVKVRGYRNLDSALGDNVETWCNFGSFIGFTGQSGETDYAAANDFLITAAQAAATRARKEVTIGWGLWREVGIGTDPVHRSFLEKSRYTPMSSAEGVYHFLREVLGSRRDPAILLLGPAESESLEDYRPGYLAAGSAASSPAQPGIDDSSRGPVGFMLDRRICGTPSRIEFERCFDLERDAYLAEHVVLGHPTLPGTFVTEIAAEAAVELVPGRVPVAFEDITLQSFLRVYDHGRPIRKRITAELIHHDSESSRVRVLVLGDVVAPTGQVLVRDRQHFQLDVLLQDRMPSAPRWERWSEHEDGAAIPDPYHMTNSPALLTGRLVSTTDTRQHALGRRATFDLHIPADDHTFAQFRLPAVLLDGMLRVKVLDPVRDGHLIVAAPMSIRRIDLYTTCNDIDLSRAHPVVDLYSCPRKLDLEAPAASNRCVAASPDGTVLAQIHDTSASILGYVHIETGRASTPRQMAADSAKALIPR